jgi:hypothetical protein
MVTLEEAEQAVSQREQQIASTRQQLESFKPSITRTGAELRRTTKEIQVRIPAELARQRAVQAQSLKQLSSEEKETKVIKEQVVAARAAQTEAEEWELARTLSGKAPGGWMFSLPASLKQKIDALNRGEKAAEVEMQRTIADLKAKEALGQIQNLVITDTEISYQEIPTTLYTSPGVFDVIESRPELKAKYGERRMIGDIFIDKSGQVIYPSTEPTKKRNLSFLGTIKDVLLPEQMGAGFKAGKTIIEIGAAKAAPVIVTGIKKTHKFITGEQYKNELPKLPSTDIFADRGLKPFKPEVGERKDQELPGLKTVAKIVSLGLITNPFIRGPSKTTTKIIKKSYDKYSIWVSEVTPKIIEATKKTKEKIISTSQKTVAGVISTSQGLSIKLDKVIGGKGPYKNELPKLPPTTIFKPFKLIVGKRKDQELPGLKTITKVLGFGLGFGLMTNPFIKPSKIPKTNIDVGISSQAAVKYVSGVVIQERKEEEIGKKWNAAVQAVIDATTYEEQQKALNKVSAFRSQGFYYYPTSKGYVFVTPDWYKGLRKDFATKKEPETIISALSRTWFEKSEEAFTDIAESFKTGILFSKTPQRETILGTIGTKNFTPEGFSYYQYSPQSKLAGKIIATGMKAGAYTLPGVRDVLIFGGTAEAITRGPKRLWQFAKEEPAEVAIAATYGLVKGYQVYRYFQPSKFGYGTILPKGTYTDKFYTSHKGYISAGKQSWVSSPYRTGKLGKLFGEEPTLFRGGRNAFARLKIEEPRLYGKIIKELTMKRPWYSPLKYIGGGPGAGMTLTKATKFLKTSTYPRIIGESWRTISREGISKLDIERAFSEAAGKGKGEITIGTKVIKTELITARKLQSITGKEFGFTLYKSTPSVNVIRGNLMFYQFKEQVPWGLKGIGEISTKPIYEAVWHTTYTAMKGYKPVITTLEKGTTYFGGKPIWRKEEFIKILGGKKGPEFISIKQFGTKEATAKFGVFKQTTIKGFQKIEWQMATSTIKPIGKTSTKTLFDTSGKRLGARTKSARELKTTYKSWTEYYGKEEEGTYRQLEELYSIKTPTKAKSIGKLISTESITKTISPKEIIPGNIFSSRVLEYKEPKFIFSSEVKTKMAGYYFKGTRPPYYDIYGNKIKTATWKTSKAEEETLKSLIKETKIGLIKSRIIEAPTYVGGRGGITSESIYGYSDIFTAGGNRIIVDGDEFQLIGGTGFGGQVSLAGKLSIGPTFASVTPIIKSTTILGKSLVTVPKSYIETAVIGKSMLDLKTSPIQRVTQIPSLTIKPTIITRPKETTITKPTTSTITRTTTIPGLTPITVPTIIPKTPPQPPKIPPKEPTTPRAPNILIGKLKPPTGKLLKFASILKQAYEVRVRRGEKFMTISKKPLPYGRAAKLGAERVTRTLAATFKLVPKGVTSEADIYYKPSPLTFRPPKSGEKLTWVEKKQFRIKKGTGEIPEILKIRGSTYKQRGGKSKRTKSIKW